MMHGRHLVQNSGSIQLSLAIKQMSMSQECVQILGVDCQRLTVMFLGLGGLARTLEEPRHGSVRLGVGFWRVAR